MDRWDPDSIFYDKYGVPVSRERWAQLFFDEEAKTVAKDVVEAGEEGATESALVSTVWLGIDHNFGGSGPPILFETMVFGGPNAGDCYRYATEAAALAGHLEVLEQVQSIMSTQESRK